MDRRAFIGRVAGGLAAAPLVAEAQQSGKVYSIAYLTIRRSMEPLTSVFLRQGLKELGWIDGQNFVFATKAAGYKSERLPELVAELVRLNVDVVIADGAETALAAKRGTRAIPIVAAAVADAVAIGLVDTLARPGGNVTGLSFLGTELIGKQMQLFKEAIPTLSRIGILSNPANPTHEPRLREIDATAQALAVRVERVTARTPTEIDQAFADMAQMRVGGVLVLSDPMLSGEEEAVHVAQLALKSGLPSMYGLSSSVRLWGGLISYGPDSEAMYRRVAGYVDRILRGAKVADLPVEQPNKFVLAINLKTSRMLGLTIPQSLLARADEVIQ
jgi:putative tryptophan/tyrosine transport system substrate-binding protein